MFRLLLLFLARGLKGCHEELAGIRAALDRAIPVRPAIPVETLVFLVDPDEEEARRVAYSQHVGRPLYDGEEIPDNFQSSPDNILSQFLGTRKKGH